MRELLTAGVFVLVAAATAAMGLRTGRRSRALDRLAPKGETAAPPPPAPALAWRELVKRMGSALPAASGSLTLLKRRLVRAGIRHPDASRYFQGIRAAGAVVLAAAGLALAVRARSAFDDLMLYTVCGAVLGFLGPAQVLAHRIRRRRRAIERGLPNALDLMVVCVESGLGIDQTIVQVARELQFAHPEICDEFTVINLELRAGKRRHEALHNLADRTGVDDVKKLVAVLAQTDRFGTSIAQTLRGHADYLRTLARQRAEERAAKLAVKLVFPIFFCVLPSLFVVTVGPVLTKLVRDLIPLIKNM